MEKENDKLLNEVKALFGIDNAVAPEVSGKDEVVKEKKK